MKKETLAEGAYKAIKEKLIFGEYKFGEELDQKMLAESLGFNSITPVREALLLLQKDKLVSIFPRKGMYVSEMSLDDVLENYQVREIIEPTVFAATADAVTLELISTYRKEFMDVIREIEENKFDLKKYLQLDMDFHLDLLRPINNHNVEKILLDTYSQNARYRMVCFQKRTSTEMVREHIDILDALQDENYGEAVNALKTHIYNSKSAFLPVKIEF